MGVFRRGYGGFMAQFVDWDLAAATAGALGKSGPKVSYAEATDVVSELRRLTEEAAGHVARYTGLRPQVTHPPVKVVDRRDWAAANIAGLREVIGPLVNRLSGDKRPGPLTAAIGSRLTGVQAGTVLAYLSGRCSASTRSSPANPASSCWLPRTSSRWNGSWAPTPGTSGSGSACTR